MGTNLRAMNRFFFGLCLVSVLSACSGGYGNKLEGKNLNVYFVDRNDEALAQDLGKFWKENNLVGQSEQNIRLVNRKGKYDVQLIASEQDKSQDLVFIEMKLLIQLRQQLDTTVFKNKKGCRLVVCDDRFKPQYVIND
ncbi:MAG: hypothetical protein RL632_2135 [Bacteroidota bacterium]